MSEQFLNGTSAQYRLCSAYGGVRRVVVTEELCYGPRWLRDNDDDECHTITTAQKLFTIGFKMIAVMKSIRIKAKLQETIKPNISNKSKNILGVDRVEQFMQSRNVEVSLSYHVIVVTLEEHMSYC